jgi:hypothetical protein
LFGWLGLRGENIIAAARHSDAEITVGIVDLKTSTAYSWGK